MNGIRAMTQRAVADPTSSGPVIRRWGRQHYGTFSGGQDRLQIRHELRGTSEPDEFERGLQAVRQTLQDPGQSMDPETSHRMGERFDHDFSGVRVHTDARAASSARAVNAIAYTVGWDVVFAAGSYSPGTIEGDRLLAHELTHVLQQGPRAGVDGPLDAGDPDHPAEREAQEVAAGMGGLGAFTEGPLAVTPSHPVLARQTGEVGAGTAGSEVYLADAGAPACPVIATGTLSETSWGETSGLYPTKDNKYDPTKWDPAKTCELLKARGAVHTVGGRGQRVHKAKPGSGAIEQKLKPYHFVENFPAVDAEIADPQVKWFYLSTQADKPDVHPGTTGTELVKSYGSFHNSGGGDVKAGDVWIHFYRLKPKPPKAPPAPPSPAPAPKDAGP